MGHKKKIGLPGGPNEIINDSKGQWNHPGKNTRIDGNDITMDDVEYPVWAQPNVGPGMMMFPDQNYSFPEAEYVDEYPVAQDGGTITHNDTTYTVLHEGDTTVTLQPISGGSVVHVDADMFKEMKLGELYNLDKKQTWTDKPMLIENPHLQKELEQNRTITPVQQQMINLNKQREQLQNFITPKEKGGSVSWNWKGKSYSGTLIPSMETEENRYARTKNGKIKTLPKAQLGKFLTTLTAPGVSSIPYIKENSGSVYNKLKHEFKKSLIPNPNMGSLMNNLSPDSNLSDEELTDFKAKKQILDAKKFAGQWMSSPMYKQMLANSMAVSESDMARERADNFALLQEDEKIDYDLTDTDIAGYSRSSTGEVFVDPDYRFQETLYDHEFSHSVDRPGDKPEPPKL